MVNKKLLSKIMSFGMALTLAFSMLPMQPVRADETKEQEETGEADQDAREVIEINTTEDFLAFADKCFLDAWSLDKIVVLNEDIDLAGSNFESIKVFTGIFDGNGHTISGFSYVGDGYVTGLFRYIEKDGVVENLHVKGNVIGTDEKECIGGLCGVNYGVIRNCSFQGNVSGRTTVGGLVGLNEGTGVIQNCFVSGRITGYYSTGGIAGKNHGELSSCTNHAYINNDSAWVEEDDEMGVGLFLSIDLGDSQTELFSGVDTGGIAGYSDGVITRCTNDSKIGYEHTGYNIGGIVGRQCGMVSSCTNAGTVYGRKDVGGIVGQMEPYIEIDEAASLRGAVNKLHDLIGKTIDDMQAGKNVLKSDLDDLAAHSERTADAGDALAEQMTDFADHNMDQIQAVTDRIDHAMDMLPDVFDDFYAAEESFSKANNVLKKIGDHLKEIEGSDDLNDAMDDAGKAMEEQQAAAERVDALIREIRDGSGATEEQIKELQAALEEMLDAGSAVMSSLGAVSGIIGQQAVGRIRDDLTDTIDHLQNAVDHVKSATKDSRSIVNYVNGQPDIHFSDLGEQFDANRENLHSELKGISESIKSLSNSASGYSDTVNNDLRVVNDQINVVFNILADDLMNYEEFGIGELYEDVDIEDTESITTGKTENCINRAVIKGDINVGGIAGAMSIDEEDPEGNAAGSVTYQIGQKYFTKCIITDCVNEGYITAKKNGAGGITGYMRHGTVVDSEGYGGVESTEGNYVGGICGESLTVIKRCYALCSVSGGKNVGGIAGYADTLQDCYAIVNCEASIGRKGAIAGQTADYEGSSDDEGQKISGNYYVGDDLYGIDNISYAGAAEPVSYEEMLMAPGLPGQFRHLKVIFRVDDLYLGEQEVKFGESLENLNYPDIPEKEGYYGVWPDYSGQVMKGNLLVSGEYKEEVTVVQSNKKQISGEEEGQEKPYALVEQRFTADTVLDVTISDMAPPEEAGTKDYVIYDIVLRNAPVGDADVFAIRLYDPYEDADVWGYRDGRWSRLESKVRGQYLQVDMTGTKEIFCIVEHTGEIGIIAGWAAGGAVVTILAVLFVKRRMRRKNARLDR